MMDFSDVLLTVDYDRTLTAPDSTIPERNLEAIRYFIENGGAFTVNTGRSVPMAKSFMDIVPVNAPLLLYNGSAAYETRTNRLEFCHEIPLCRGWTPTMPAPRTPAGRLSAVASTAPANSHSRVRIWVPF